MKRVVCCRCGTEVKPETELDYPYYCPCCDENKYTFETRETTTSLLGDIVIGEIDKRRNEIMNREDYDYRIEGPTQKEELLLDKELECLNELRVTVLENDHNH